MNETVTMNVQDLCRGYSIGYATDLNRVPLTEHRMFFLLCYRSMQKSIKLFFFIGKSGEQKERAETGSISFSFVRAVVLFFKCYHVDKYLNFMFFKHEIYQLRSTIEKQISG
jgi:hypothetical protein